ncbi:MAG: PadR family transcriptional regulator [Oscillospiraceae bacterium]|jgi:DNA-binding PadR family transcriptional regulator|nr:PadR family transcriptional regulator [Oscillospiraceae bacterium]
MTLDGAKKTYMPMTETMFYILLSLTEPRHGYGIMQHVEEITGERIRLGAGTIYNSLSKLERSELIELITETERRKIYLITEVGQELLKAEIVRLEELAENGRKYM